MRKEFKNFQSQTELILYILTKAKKAMTYKEIHSETKRLDCKLSIRTLYNLILKMKKMPIGNILVFNKITVQKENHDKGRIANEISILKEFLDIPISDLLLLTVSTDQRVLVSFVKKYPKLGKFFNIVAEDIEDNEIPLENKINKNNLSEMILFVLFFKKGSTIPTITKNINKIFIKSFTFIEIKYYIENELPHKYINFLIYVDEKDSAIRAEYYLGKYIYANSIDIYDLLELCNGCLNNWIDFLDSNPELKIYFKDKDFNIGQFDPEEKILSTPNQDVTKASILAECLTEWDYVTSSALQLEMAKYPQFRIHPRTGHYLISRFKTTYIGKIIKSEKQERNHIHRQSVAVVKRWFLVEDAKKLNIPKEDLMLLLSLKKDNLVAFLTVYPSLKKYFEGYDKYMNREEENTTSEEFSENDTKKEHEQRTTSEEFSENDTKKEHEQSSIIINISTINISY